MPIGKTIKKKLGSMLKKKKRESHPDMPEDAEELARAMFWPNEQKRREAQKKGK